MRSSFGLLLAFGILAGACQPSVVPAPSGGPARGGILTVALWQEPSSIAPLSLGQTVGGLVAQVATEGLTRADNDGNFEPVLAAQIPTLADGGVRLSADSRRMEVTWQLRPGLKWSDGAAVTSADIKFTWETWLKLLKSTGFSEIESIDLPDELTAVLHYRSIYAPYLTTFGPSGGPPIGVLLPKHVLEKEADIGKSEYARLPLGTGPFRFTDFKPRESITAERNPYYRKPGRPYLDRIVFKLVGSRETALAQLVSGEVQGMWNPSESQIPDLARYPSIRLMVTLSAVVERIEFNFAQNRDMTDPASVHPVLGELAVRRALLLATPKQQIIDKLLYGNARAGSSVLALGWAAPKGLAQEGYDPQKARRLLDQAGWVTGDDGVRAKAGVRASITMSTTIGDQTRERVEEILVDAYRQIGIELTTRNVTIGELSSTWAAGGLIQRGAYDLLLTGVPVGVDPAPVLARYLSSSIPSAANGSGPNHLRFKSAAVDNALQVAATTLDLDQRRAAYAEAARLLNDAVAAIWLYERVQLNAYRVGVNGWVGQIWDQFTWNTEDWYLQRSSR